MKRYKRFVAGVLLGSMVLNVNIFAAQVVVTQEKPNEGFSHIKLFQDDKGISTYATYQPSKDDVHDLNDGKMTFYGEANISDLYTDTHFTGKSNITYRIENNHLSEDLVAKIYQYGNPIAKATINVKANTNQTGSISDLDSSKLYYIRFIAPSNFSGYVQ